MSQCNTTRIKAICLMNIGNVCRQVYSVNINGVEESNITIMLIQGTRSCNGEPNVIVGFFLIEY